MAVIENLKATAPPELKKKQKRSKLEQAHLALIATLENRIETIDAELVVCQIDISVGFTSLMRTNV